MPCHGKITVIKRSGVDGTHFPLTATTCLFGRKADCDIRIQMPHVSKEHCKVEVMESGEVLVTNLSSVNPTQLNGNALKQPVCLKHGDIITIIDRSFRFESLQSQPGRRRSAGLDSEHFKLFASNPSEDTNETVRIERITTTKVQRKSEGNVTRTTHTRRSLQTSSSGEKKDHSPFGELYEMLKNKVASRKKENGQTPVKESNISPKNLTIKRIFQAEAVSHSPSTSRRDSRRSQSSDAATVRSRDIKAETRAVSADRVREQSKSPSRGSRNSMTKQKSGRRSVELNTPNISNKSVQCISTHEEGAQDHSQTPKRRSGKEVSSFQEKESSVVSLEKSPRSVEENKAVGLVSSPAGSSWRSRSQAVRRSPGIENQENSPLPVKSPKGRRSGTKGTPTKPVEKGETVNEHVQGKSQKSAKKRRSDDLGLPEPPLKRKRVSFGGHLSPELFDKRLPPNSPLKKGATPARRSLSLNSPRAVIRKSFGLKQAAIKEVFELSLTRPLSSPSVTSITPTKRASASGVAHSPVPEGSSDAATGDVLVSSPNKRSSAVNKKSPIKSPISGAKTPVKPLPKKRSPSLSPLRTSPSTRPPATSPSKTVVQSPVKSEPTIPARSSVSKLPASAKKSPVKSTKRSPSRSPIPQIESEAIASLKLSTPGKKSLGKSPAPTSASSSTPSKRSPGRLPSTTPAKKSPAKLATPTKRSPGKSPATLSAPGKRSPGKSPATLSTPGKRSPGKSPATLSTPGKRSPGKSPATLSTPGKRSPGRPATSPAKKSPAKLATPSKRSPGRPPSTSPAKKSPAKLATSTKRSLGKSSASLSTPGKRSSGRPPSTSPAKKSPAKLATPTKRSPGKSPASLSTPGKRSPGRPPSTSPAKKSPAKLVTPSKRSPGRPPSTSPAKKSPAKLATPTKRSPGKSQSTTSATLSTPGKRSPGRSPSTTPANKSHKLSTPAKRSPGKSQSSTPAKKSKLSTPSTRFSGTKSPSSTKKPVILTSPGKRSPSTPYTKGRFSISRVNTPPQVVENVSKIHPSQTPKQLRKSMTTKKTPLRRSRKLDAFEAIRARRRSGASEANLLVAKSWADVVKVGVAKPQKKIIKPIKKAVATKKTLKLKTPARRVKDLSSTGHVDSPATILVGRAHSRTLNLTGYVPKVIRNEAVKLNLSHNESFTGMTELFSTPVNATQRRSSRYDGSKAGTPKSTAEVSAIQTPEEAGEMVVSPLNSPATTQRKRYGRDAVSRLLEVPVSPELSVVNRTISENAEPEVSKSSMGSRKSLGLTGVKRMMRTPKQKGKPVTDPHALKKLLRTPEEIKSTQVATRRSAKLEVLGIARLMKTPRQKGETMEDFTGVKRVLKTPKQKGEPVEDYTGVKRIMQTPKERGQPVEDMVGIKRVMQTPKERGEAVEDMIGIKRIMRTPKQSVPPVEDVIGIKHLMRTPKERGQPVEDIDISHLMSTPADSTQSAENTRPIEEIFGIKNLVKTPPKKSTEQAFTTDPKNASEALKSPGTNSNTAKRGRPSKRLSLPDETATTEMPEESLIPEMASPSRGRLRTTSEVPKESQVFEADVTSPARRGRPRSTVLSPVAGNVPLQVDEGSISQVHAQSVSNEVTSPSRRGRPRSSATPTKESVTEEISPTRMKRNSAAVAKESLLASAEERTSPGARPSGTLKAAEEYPPTSLEITSPTRRGRPSRTAVVAKDQVFHVKVTSPTLRGSPSRTSEIAKASLLESKIISPKDTGRPSTTMTSGEPVPNENTSGKITSPARKGRPSATAETPKESVKISDTEITSPFRRGKSQSVQKELKESPKVSNVRVVSPSRRGRSVKESVPVEVALQTRRGSSRNPVEVPKDTSPVAKAAVVSPVHSTASTITVEIPKEIPQTHGRRSKSTAQRRGRLIASAELPEEPVVVNKASTIRRGRAKASVDVPEKFTVSETRSGRAKEKTDLPEEPGPAASEDITSTRRRRFKAVIKESVPEESRITSTHVGRPATSDIPKESIPVISDVTSPPTRGRPKRTDIPKEPIPVTSDVTSPPRRGRPKSTDVIKEPVAVTSDVTSPPRRGRSKTVDVTKELVPAVGNDVTSPIRKGRSKTVKVPAASDSLPKRTGRSKTKNIPENPVPVSDSVAMSSASGGRLHNNDTPKESATVSVESPKPRGRPGRSTEKSQSSVDGPEKTELSVNISPASKPIARRGGRRRNNEQLADVGDPQPEEPKLGARRKGQSSYKNSDETSKETVDVHEHARSPAAKSLKRSAKHQKNLRPEHPVEDLAKNIRGRQSKTSAKDDSTESSASEITETDLPQKRTPTKRSRARDTSNVYAEEQVQQESLIIAPISKQRGRRKNQYSSNETLVQAEPPAAETSRATRGRRGLPVGEEPQPAAEIKGRKNSSVSEDMPSKTKSVQWHPLLTTDGNAKSTDKVGETSKASTRGGRSKGRTKDDTPEPIPVKRPRSDQSEPSAISEVNTSSSVGDTSVSQGRRGRKVAMPQKQLETENPSDIKFSLVETTKSLAKQALQPARGRKAAASRKALDSENNEVDAAVEVPTSRGRKGAASAQSQSPAKPQNNKKVVLAKESKTEGIAIKAPRGVKRRHETPSSDNSTADHSEAENVPTVLGKRNARNAKAEKGKPTDESLVVKLISSPAKRRKTESATSAITVSRKSKETSKPETVKPTVATRVRASTRSRK